MGGVQRLGCPRKRKQRVQSPEQRGAGRGGLAGSRVERMSVGARMPGRRSPWAVPGSPRGNGLINFSSFSCSHVTRSLKSAGEQQRASSEL